MRAVFIIERVIQGDAKETKHSDFVLVIVDCYLFF